MTNSKAPVSGEDALIARYFKPLATDPGAFDLVDDAAILNTSGEDVVVKTDAIQRGESYIKHIPSSDIAAAAAHGKLEATTDFARVKEVDAIVLCVPTPLDKHFEPIRGLYAAGEVAGMAGGHINGKAGLEGTMLGPSIFSGRVAGGWASQEAGHGEGFVGKPNRE